MGITARAILGQPPELFGEGHQNQETKQTGEITGGSSFVGKVEALKDLHGGIEVEVDQDEEFFQMVLQLAYRAKGVSKIKYSCFLTGVNKSPGI
jgi:hypothetical protein